MNLKGGSCIQVELAVFKIRKEQVKAGGCGGGGI
jgi:hypothetical protein